MEEKREGKQDKADKWWSEGALRTESCTRLQVDLLFYSVQNARLHQQGHKCNKVDQRLKLDRLMVILGTFSFLQQHFKSVPNKRRTQGHTPRRRINESHTWFFCTTAQPPSRLQRGTCAVPLAAGFRSSVTLPEPDNKIGSFYEDMEKVDGSVR